MALVITEFMYAEFVSGTLEFQSHTMISNLNCSSGYLPSCSNEAANLFYTYIYYFHRKFKNVRKRECDTSLGCSRNSCRFLPLSAKNMLHSMRTLADRKCCAKK